MTNGDRRDGDDKGDGKPDGGSNEGDKNDADDSGLRVRKLRPAAVEALIGEMKILDASLGDLFTRVCDAKLGAARQDVAGAVAEIKELATSVGEVVDVEGRVKGVDAMRVKLGALIDASGTVTGKREAPTELGGVGRAADGGWVLFRQLLDRLKLSSWALKAFLNQRSTWPNGAVLGMLMLLTALFVVFLTTWGQRDAAQANSAEWSARYRVIDHFWTLQGIGSVAKGGEYSFDVVERQTGLFMTLKPSERDAAAVETHYLVSWHNSLFLCRYKASDMTIKDGRPLGSTVFPNFNLDCRLHAGDVLVDRYLGRERIPIDRSDGGAVTRWVPVEKWTNFERGIDVPLGPYRDSDGTRRGFIPDAPSKQ